MRAHHTMHDHDDSVSSDLYHRTAAVPQVHAWGPGSRRLRKGTEGIFRMHVQLALLLALVSSVTRGNFS